MASVLAELLVARGCRVDVVTPAAKVAEWTVNRLEQAIIQRRMLEIGVSLHLGHQPDRGDALSFRREIAALLNQAFA